MKPTLFQSFRGRLFLGMLISSLIPVLICFSMLLQIFRVRMTTDAERASSEQLSHISASFDSLSASFFDAAQQIREDSVIRSALLGGPEDSAQVYGRLYTITEGLRSYARFDLYNADGTWYYSTQNEPREHQLSTDWGILQAAGQGLTFCVSEDAPDGSGALYQGAARLTDEAEETAGYLVISLDASHFQNILENTYSAQNEVILLSQYWHPVYCGKIHLAKELGPLLRQQLMDGSSLNQVSEGYLYYVVHHAPTQLYIVLQYPDVSAQDTLALLSTVTLSCAVICVIFSILISLTLCQQLIKPIKQLNRGINEVVANNLDVYVPAYHNDELGQLSEHFNAMVTALKHNQEELLQRQVDLNEAQIRMLQAQLSPHFLCNTLDTIKWIGKINQVPQVADMAINLADILRFCISPEEFVTLDREVEMVTSYIEIQRIRLSSEFQFSVELPPELGNCLVPKMILQPITENAILHGIDGKADGIIRIRVDAIGTDLLRITVSDNGRGFPPDMIGSYGNRDLQHLQGHLGLYNVNTILTKYYGERFGLYLANLPDRSGAAVIARLPIRRKEDKV